VVGGGERLAGLVGHPPPGQWAVAGRGEQPQGVPTVPPRPAGAALRVEDDEVGLGSAQEVPGGEPGLPTPDHGDVGIGDMPMLGASTIS
jgi:hypothetical protein